MTDAPPTTSPAAYAERGNWRQRLGLALYAGASRIDWAEPEIRGLAQVVDPGATVLDVGAALGMYTVPLSYLTGPRGRVDSFDPQPRNFYVVRALRWLTGTRRGLIRRLAMGPRAGESAIAVPVIFGLPIFGHGHIADGVQEKGPHRIRYTPTTVDTIDAWVEREGLGPIGFIKVDVEGFEPAVLEGAEAVVTRDLPSLLLEIEDRRLVRYGRTTAADFHARVMKQWPTYRMYTWVRGAWTPTDEIRPEVRNYLFTTRQLG